MADGETRRNAVVGGIIAFVLSWIPIFGPVVGGAVAGYRQDGERADGLRVGVYSGLVACVPTLVWMVILASGFGSIGVIGMNAIVAGASLIGLLFLLIWFLVFGVYLIGCSALGGWVGNYVRYDTDWGRSSTPAME